MADNGNSNLDERVTSLEKQVAVVAANVDALIQELNEFINELHESRARRDEDMREIREVLNNNVRNMFITVIIGIGAMVVAVLMK
ncbi:MAG: hypothetical protein IJR52_09580 [Selenomonadaceae bacterium]|nr:hypothetical protein [Selenomonadaceae bacterium]MBQ9497802.1 hypothetical protein [Selenomonadaceae bacterium]